MYRSRSIRSRQQVLFLHPAGYKVSLDVGCSLPEEINEGIPVVPTDAVFTHDSGAAQHPDGFFGYPKRSLAREQFDLCGGFVIDRALIDAP